MEVTVANEDIIKDVDKEAGIGVGMGGDATSIKIKPADAEQAPPDHKAAEQMSHVKPNPKDRLAGGTVNAASICCLDLKLLLCTLASLQHQKSIHCSTATTLQELICCMSIKFVTH